MYLFFNDWARKCEYEIKTKIPKTLYVSNYKRQQEECVMLDKRDFLLLLLHVKGKSDKANEVVRGRLKLMKLVFLLDKEENIREYSKSFYEFESLNYGPFSKELLQDLDVLVQEGLVEEKSQEVNTPIGSIMRRSDYELTEKGIELVETIAGDASIIEKITRIKKKYNRMDTEKILTYVYTKYPEFAKNSKIVDNILA